VATSWPVILRPPYARRRGGVPITAAVLGSPACECAPGMMSGIGPASRILSPVGGGLTRMYLATQASGVDRSHPASATTHRQAHPTHKESR